MATLALGTVQFGMAYGVANTAGKPGLDTVAEILTQARRNGIDTLDTAIAYGEAETVLGQVGTAGWRIVTKLPAVPEDTRDIAGWMETQITASLSRLGASRLYALLLHNPVQMHGPRAEAIAAALATMADRGLARRVGVSIQHPDTDLPAVLAHMDPGLIQSPFNLIDDALVRNGWATRLRGAGCRIHARSAFLQGLLVMPDADRPAWFDRWSGHWREWRRWLEAEGLTAPEACLRFVLSRPDIDCCVAGVDTPAQLAELLSAGDAPLRALPAWPGPPDSDLITPFLWKTT